MSLPLPSPPPRIGTLKRLLSQHPYFLGWDDEQLKQLEGHCCLLELPAQACLLEPGSLDPQIHFLLEGQLQLTDVEGRRRLVSAEDSDASYPVSRLRPSQFRVETQTPSVVFGLEQAVVRRLASRPPKARFRQGARATGGSWQQHPLVRDVVIAAKAGTLKLPVIPGIALKVRRALAKEDFNMDQIGQIIAADPVISAKLIRLANSALYQGTETCTSVQTAVVRLGLSKVQNVVLALSSATLFDSKRPALREHLVQVWRHLVQVGALSAALARRNGELDMDLALLGGLLHEIGKIPILEMAIRREDLWTNPGLLEDILEGLAPMISAATLRQWRLPESLIQAAKQQHNYAYDHSGQCDVTDVLLVAHILSLAQAGTRSELPRLDETPAFSRITQQRLTPSESAQVLLEVQEQTGELKQLLA